MRDINDEKICGNRTYSYYCTNHNIFRDCKGIHHYNGKLYTDLSQNTHSNHRDAIFPSCKNIL